MMILLAWCAALALAVGSGVAFGETPRKRVPDVVSLTNGKVLEGIVLYEDDKEVIIRVKSKTRTFERADVVSVDSNAHRMRAFMRDLAWLNPHASAVDQWTTLARENADYGLEHESQLCWLRVLIEDPANVAAHEALGHRLRSGKYRIKAGGKQLEWDKYIRSHEKWRDAWELRTSHFALKSNLDLAAAIDAAFDLELQYARFFREFAQPLRLMELTEPLRAEVHTRGNSFRHTSPGERGRFDVSSETLMLNADPSTDSYDRGLLFHETTHALLHASIQQRKGTTVLPGWVAEGVSEYFAAQARDGDNRAFDFAKIRHAHNVRTHAQAAEPLMLKRLLNVNSGEFLVGDTSGIRYAQSYTLVLHLLRADDGAYRDAFYAYLDGALDGASSATSFKRAVGRDLKPIEADWIAYVLGLENELR